MKKLFFSVLIICISIQGYGQQKEKITYESVKQQCAGMPFEKRARVSVTKFNSGTNTPDQAVRDNVNANNSLKRLGTFSKILGGGGDAPRADEIPVELGTNLATMLTNALQGVNCFRVLESLKNNEDLTSEIEAGNNKLSSKKTPKAGKQLGAQVVATGEILEYSVKDKGRTIMGVYTGNKFIKLGFNLKLINPETRDIIASHVFRVQSASGTSVSVLNMVSTSSSDPATAAVMEDGIIKAVEFMAHVRDSLNITVDNIPGNAPIKNGGGSEIEVTLNNANYSSFSGLASIIAALPEYKAMEKSLVSGVGTFTVTYGKSADNFLDELNKKTGNKYEVTGFDSGKVELKAK